MFPYELNYMPLNCSYLPPFIVVTYLVTFLVYKWSVKSHLMYQ